MDVPVGPATEASFTLRFQQRRGYLTAHVGGPRNSHAIMLAYWNAIATECRRLDSQCLLVHDNLEGVNPSLDELGQLVLEMAGKGLESVRIAYIEHESAYIPLMEMAESIAREHGFTARVFNDEDTALRWLRYGPVDEA